MRLPFLQVSQEEMARARTLAGYLGVTPQHALGMVVALKAAALEVAPEEDVSGIIRDHHPAEWVAVQCGWPLDRSDSLMGAMVRCGFVVAGPSGGHAVAGMEPYAKALDTSGKRSEAGRKGAEARKTMGGYGKRMAGPSQNNGHDMARDAKTQTQTQKEETTSLSARADGQEELPDATDDAQPVTERMASTISAMPEAQQGALLPLPEKPKERPEDLQALWNAEAHPNLPRWEALTDKRRRHATTRLRERPLAEWREVIRRMNTSPFLRGEQGTWRASPDWLLQPDSGVKVLEGKYDPPKASGADVPRLGPKPVGPSSTPAGDRPRL